MTLEQVIAKIRQRAEELDISLESLGIYDDDDLLLRAAKLFFNSLEDLDEELLEEEVDEELTDDDLI